MKRLRHSDTQHEHKPAAGHSERKPFRLMEGLRELRYRRALLSLERTEQRLLDATEKQKAFAEYSRLAHGALVNEDESNWDHAMACASKAKAIGDTTLRREAKGAAFHLYTMVFSATTAMAGAALIGVNLVLKEMNPILIGGIMSLANLCTGFIFAFAKISTIQEDYLKLVSQNVEEGISSLREKRGSLMRKIHELSREN
jgi:hypothetical protein